MFPQKGKALWDRFEFVHHPKHGSWLNMLRLIECAHEPMLNRRIDIFETVKKEVRHRSLELIKMQSKLAIHTTDCQS